MIGPAESGGGSKRVRFAFGRAYATPSIFEKVPADEIKAALNRHVAGDWGEVNAEDWKANDRALTDGTRLLSVFRSACGLKFLIITEGDRSSTTVLFPDEY